MPDARLHAICSAYNATVLLNTSPAHDARTIVHADEDSEVMWEVWQMADELGISLTDDERDAVWDLWQNEYRPRLA